MEFMLAGKIDSFSSKPWKVLTLLGRKVLLRVRPDGSFSAIEAQCKHQGADLTQGHIENNIVTCPRHGWKYNLETGECINQNSTPLRKYQVRVDGDDVFVSIHPILADD